MSSLASRPRSRTLLRTAGAAAAAAALVATLAAPAQARPDVKTMNLKVPLTGFVFSDAGRLTVTGTVHLVGHPNDPYSPVDPYEPADPYRVHTNLIKVTASNAAVSCKSTGAQSFVLPSLGSEFTGSYRMEPLDPYRPGDPLANVCSNIGTLDIEYRLDFTDDGTVTGAIAVVDSID